MKRSIILISMDDCAYERDILKDHLCHLDNVLRVSVMDGGFFVDYRYEDDVERKRFLSNLMCLDINRIELYDILYEEFLKGR